MKETNNTFDGQWVVTYDCLLQSTGATEGLFTLESELESELELELELELESALESVLESALETALEWA